MGRGPEVEALEGLWRLLAPFAGCVDPAIPAFEAALEESAAPGPRRESGPPLAPVTLFYNKPIRPPGA